MMIHLFAHVYLHELRARNYTFIHNGKLVMIFNGL